MDLYFYSPSQQKHYKLTKVRDRSFLYWVAVYPIDGGGFFHGRGRDFISDFDKAQKLMEEMGKPTSEPTYINALKDYFAIDKRDRDLFIRQFNL